MREKIMELFEMALVEEEIKDYRVTEEDLADFETLIKEYLRNSKALTFKQARTTI